MKNLAAILFISVMAMGVFGFVAFNHEMSGKDSGCIASVIDGTDCPPTVLQSVAHHIEAFKGFFQATISEMGSYAISLLLLLSILPILWFSYKKLSDLKLLPQFEYIRKSKQNLYLSKRRITSWLALFELSPAL